MTQTTLCEGNLCPKPNSQPVTHHEINDVGRELCETCASPLGHQGDGCWCEFWRVRWYEPPVRDVSTYDMKMLAFSGAVESDTTIRFTLPAWELVAKVAGWGVDNELMRTQAMWRWGQMKVLEYVRRDGLQLQLPPTFTLCTVGGSCFRINAQRAVELLTAWGYPVVNPNPV